MTAGRESGEPKKGRICGTSCAFSAPDELAGPIRRFLVELHSLNSRELTMSVNQGCRKHIEDENLTVINVLLHSISILEK